jgi:hypothetical protein
MRAFDAKTYVPILLTKRAELTAISELPAPLKSTTKPLFVVHPRDIDFDGGSPKKSVADHISKLPASLIKAWGPGEAFLDLIHIDDDPVGGGEHALEWIVDECATSGLLLTPACSPTRSSDYLAAVGRVVAKHGSGICIRVTADEWPGSHGPGAVDGLMSRFSIGKPSTHLVLDVEGETGNTASTALSAELRLLPDVGDWASVTMAGSGRPSALPTTKGLHEIDRTEWAMYRAIAASHPTRVPSYGDYGIASLETLNIDPRVMSISGKITYTADSVWLFAKGDLFKGPAGRSMGGNSVVEPCRLVAASSKFTNGHCYFEQWVREVAAGTTQGSGPEQWLRHGTLHHLITVSEQIASLP